MAFPSKCSSLLRSTLSRLYGLPPHPHLAPPPWSFLPGARFMSSGPSSKLFVGGLSWGTDENALREAFSSFGEVIEAKVVMDRETGRSKGFGFVSFTSTADAESAMQSMDGRSSQDLGGRTLRVNFAIEKPPSARSFGGFGGDSEGFGGGRGGFGGGGDYGSSQRDSFEAGDSSFSRSANDFDDDSFGKDSFGNDSLGKDSFGSDSFDEDKDDFGKDGLKGGF